MLMDQYDVITRDGRHVTVFATDHEITDGDLILHRTNQGILTDTFPEGYWTRFAVNGVEQIITPVEESQ